MWSYIQIFIALCKVFVRQTSRQNLKVLYSISDHVINCSIIISVSRDSRGWPSSFVLSLEGSWSKIFPAWEQAVLQPRLKHSGGKNGVVNGLWPRKWPLSLVGLRGRLWVISQQSHVTRDRGTASVPLPHCVPESWQGNRQREEGSRYNFSRRSNVRRRGVVTTPEGEGKSHPCLVWGLLWSSPEFSELIFLSISKRVINK